MPATAPVEIWPTNQVSVRLMMACRLLLAMSGNVSCRTAPQSIRDWPAASMRCAGNAVAAGAAGPIASMTAPGENQRRM